MELFFQITNTIVDYLYIGMLIGLLLLVIHKLFIYCCRKSDGSKNILSIFKILYIRFAVAKINKIGLDALAYSPIIDGKKVTTKEARDDLAFNYQDPLILEQDHSIRGYIYNKNLSILFYKHEDSSVKGYFHVLGRKTVYAATLKVSDK